MARAADLLALQLSAKSVRQMKNLRYLVFTLLYFALLAFIVAETVVGLASVPEYSHGGFEKYLTWPIGLAVPLAFWLAHRKVYRDIKTELKNIAKCFGWFLLCFIGFSTLLHFYGGIPVLLCYWFAYRRVYANDLYRNIVIGDL